MATVEEKAGPSRKTNKNGFLYFDLGVDEIYEDLKKCEKSLDVTVGKDQHAKLKDEYSDILEKFKTFKFDVKSWDIYKSYGNQIPNHMYIKLTVKRDQIIKAIEWLGDDLHYFTAEQEMLDEMSVLEGPGVSRKPRDQSKDSAGDPDSTEKPQNVKTSTGITNYPIVTNLFSAYFNKN